MTDTSKKILKGIFIIAAILLAGYILYRVYNYAVSDATQRIKQGVSEGVGEGIGGAINPLSWPRRAFGN